MDEGSRSSLPINDDELFRQTQLSCMIIKSVDTLCGKKRFDDRIPAEWNYDPPLLLKVPNPRSRNGRGIVGLGGGGGDQKTASPEENERLLKGMIRLGIPSALRCAVWLSNIMQALHPQEPESFWLEYRTLAKIRALDGAYQHILDQIISENRITKPSVSSDDNDSRAHIVSENSVLSANENILSPPSHNKLLSTSPDKNAIATTTVATNNTTLSASDEGQAIWDSMEAWNFGRSSDAPTIEGICPAGALALKRVLIAAGRILSIGFAPLIPTLTSLFLTSMSESYAFYAIREMAHQSSNGYFPVSMREHIAWCYAFGDILRKLHPQTASYLEDRGVLDVDGLAPIFQHFFVGVLPLEYVQRILDIYTLESSKVLFRFGVALFVMYKLEAAENLITISNADEWWHTMKNWSHSRRFNFTSVVRKAYGVHGHGLRRQMNFPRRSVIQRIIRLEEASIKREEMENGKFVDEEDDSFLQPLGLIHPQLPANARADTEIAKPVLIEQHAFRLLIAKWLPITLRLSNLELLYSTSYHGRTLERFFSHVRNAKHTVLVCEVQRKNSDGGTTILGMYASQTWRVSPRVYGDGSVFLFRLQPNPKCWKWHPAASQNVITRGNIIDQVGFEDDVKMTFSNDNSSCSSKSNNRIALMEQFMISTTQFISMGGNTDGSCGLRINEDLTKGESSPAAGFDNEPLHGTQVKDSVFDIGLLEVYGFIRQIDGKPI